MLRARARQGLNVYTLLRSVSLIYSAMEFAKPRALGPFLVYIVINQAPIRSRSSHVRAEHEVIFDPPHMRHAKML